MTIVGGPAFSPATCAPASRSSGFAVRKMLNKQIFTLVKDSCPKPARLSKLLPETGTEG
jgi:hypothetical protein